MNECMKVLALLSMLSLPQDVWKALPGWIMLTRRHAQGVVSLPGRVDTDDLVLAWNTVHAPEEVLSSIRGYSISHFTCLMTTVDVFPYNIGASGTSP